ncbi:MAG: tetratricopeptide repeat protein [Acutalibacteraceae bacterium]
MNAIESYNQGCNYYYGSNGYPFDYQKAFDLFIEAANGGISNAMNNLGLMYMNGQGVTQDYNMAFKWLEKALLADNYNYLAYHNMARLFYNGFGVPKNIEKAYNCYTKAVGYNNQKNGSVYIDDCFMVGCILINNFNRLKDAFPYFKEAATKGNKPEAWHNMGYICSKKGIPGANRQTSFPYFLKAAELGSVESMYEVGCIYISKMMYNEGIPWVEKAAARGYEPARKNLKKFRAARAAKSGSILDYFG